MAVEICSLRLAKMEALIPKLDKPEGKAALEEVIGQPIPAHLEEWLFKESRMIIDWERDYALRNGRVFRFVESLTEEEREDLESALHLHNQRSPHKTEEQRNNYLQIVGDYNLALAAAGEPLISIDLEPLRG